MFRNINTILPRALLKCSRNKTSGVKCQILSNKFDCGLCYIYTVLIAVLDIRIPLPFIKFGDTRHTMVCYKKTDNSFIIDIILLYIGMPLFSYIYSLNIEKNIQNVIHIIGTRNIMKCARIYNYDDRCNNRVITDTTYCLTCENELCSRLIAEIINFNKNSLKCVRFG